MKRVDAATSRDALHFTLPFARWRHDLRFVAARLRLHSPPMPRQRSVTGMPRLRRSRSWSWRYAAATPARSIAAATIAAGLAAAMPRAARATEACAVSEAPSSLTTPGTRPQCRATPRSSACPE